MTVTDAARASAEAQALGLTDAEFERIGELLGRDPNALELAVFSLMWSEHCAYKHSQEAAARAADRGRARA